MKAIILAAGRGSRMGGATAERPKCLVELAGRPLLDWQIHALRQGGIDDIAIVRGWQAEKLDGRGLKTFDNPRWNSTNMVMSLACAGQWLEAERCIVSYSDIFYPAAAVQTLAGSPHDLSIAYDPHWAALWSRRFADPLSDAETFRIDGQGRLESIGSRPATMEEVQGQYMGLLHFSPAGWAAVASLLAGLPDAERDRLDMTSLLSRLLARGEAIHGVPVEGPWGEVDNETDLALYHAMIADGQLPASPW